MVQVRDATTGVWGPVTGLVSTPAYPGDLGTAYETFQLRFDPTVGDGIRLHGDPGGSLEFVSAGELRVLATPPGSTGQPQAFTAQLAVTDAQGGGDLDPVLVSVDNTPPIAAIVSPPAGATYPVGVITPINLLAFAGDAETPTANLVCEWNLTLVHENHLHPENPQFGCDVPFVLVPHDELGGDVIYWTVELTVTDPQGLSRTVVHDLFPQGDCNVNGIADAAEIIAGTVLDLDLDGIPDECQTLSANKSTVSVTGGGMQLLTLAAGAANAGNLYLLAGTATGTLPGIDLGGAVLPLNPDGYFQFTLNNPNKPPLGGSFGMLDGAGGAMASFALAPSSTLVLIGQTVHHAFVAIDPAVPAVTLVSNPVLAELTF